MIYRDYMTDNKFTYTQFSIYTDGACRGNGQAKNIGGWGFIVTENNMLIHEEVKIEFNTTNNRQEMTAVLNAILFCKENNIESFRICSDSQYVVNGFNDWMYKWAKKGWIRGKGITLQVIPNADIWRQLYSETVGLMKVDLIWVRGHNGNKWNEYADKLIESAIEKTTIKCQ